MVLDFSRLLKIISQSLINKIDIQLLISSNIDQTLTSVFFQENPRKPIHDLFPMNDKSKERKISIL